MIHQRLLHHFNPHHRSLLLLIHYESPLHCQPQHQRKATVEVGGWWLASSAYRKHIPWTHLIQLCIRLMKLYGYFSRRMRSSLIAMLHWEDRLIKKMGLFPKSSHYCIRQYIYEPPLTLFSRLSKFRNFCWGNQPKEWKIVRLQTCFWTAFPWEFADTWIMQLRWRHYAAYFFFILHWFQA